MWLELAKAFTELHEQCPMMDTAKIMIDAHGYGEHWESVSELVEWILRGEKCDIEVMKSYYYHVIEVWP